MPKKKRQKSKQRKRHFLFKVRDHWANEKMTYEEVRAFEELNRVIRKSIADGLKDHESDIKSAICEAVKSAFDRMSLRAEML